MGRITKIVFVVILSAAFVGIPLYCFSGETGDPAKLIKEANTYIQAGNKEKAISTLDAAFAAAYSARDYDALMEIGDLYIGIDKSLKDEAMRAWTAAGRSKCQ